MAASKTHRINARLPPDVARKVAYLERCTKMSTTEIVTESIDRYYAAIVHEEGSPAEVLERAGFVACARGPEGSLCLVQGQSHPFHREEDWILADTGFWLALADAVDHITRGPGPRWRSTAGPS